MKVGDLIKYELDTGLVLEISEDGSTQGMALVLWQDGQVQRVACVMCEVINESR
jgi:hypothetical protein